MKALFIGRFQPLHLGHASVIENILKAESECIIGIGSSEKHHTADNPFTYEERKMMVENAISKNANYKVFPIPDINNYGKWVEHVKNIVGDFDVIYTGNGIVKELFLQKNYKIKDIEERIYISASAVRDMMCRGDEWKKFVPKSTAQIIETIKGVERIKSVQKQYLNPIPAVDMIIKYNNGIVLIERQDGTMAIPGGFVNFGERCQDAAIREAKEETNLEFKIDNLLNVYSDPKRDPRNHIISITYFGEGSGDLVAGDDAKKTIIVPLNKALKMDLAFDHKQILQDYAKYKKQ